MQLSRMEAHTEVFNLIDRIGYNKTFEYCLFKLNNSNFKTISEKGLAIHKVECIKLLVDLK